MNWQVDTLPFNSSHKIGHVKTQTEFGNDDIINILILRTHACVETSKRQQRVRRTTLSLFPH